jgi:hypothetical protein
MRVLPEQVELLLEGLQGADTADTYKFHVERGYGSQYYDQVRRLWQDVRVLGCATVGAVCGFAWVAQ